MTSGHITAVYIYLGCLAFLLACACCTHAKARDSDEDSGLVLAGPDVVVQVNPALQPEEPAEADEQKRHEYADSDAS